MVYFINYRPDISVVDGEDWYLGHHAREGKLNKLIDEHVYKTWKTIRVPEDSKSRFRPNRWYRLTHLGLPPSRVNWPKKGEEPTRILYAQSPLGWVVGEWRNILIKPELVQDLLK
jgi:hypothetical protein